MISFGTSGWRAVMGEEFTFQNVRLVVQALANLLRAKYAGADVSVLVNYDTRFLSERFAVEAARILSHNKIQVFLSERDAPSQAQAYQIIKRRAQGGINFTASFNPPEYNGLKYNVETGAPAMPAGNRRPGKGNPPPAGRLQRFSGVSEDGIHRTDRPAERLPGVYPGQDRLRDHPEGRHQGGRGFALRDEPGVPG